MQSYQCFCGESSAFGSMPPAPCTCCPKCGTRLLQVSMRNLPRDDEMWDQKEHEWCKQFDWDTGEPFDICVNCLKKKE